MKIQSVNKCFCRWTRASINGSTGNDQLLLPQRMLFGVCIILMGLTLLFSSCVGISKMEQSKCNLLPILMNASRLSFTIR